MERRTRVLLFRDMDRLSGIEGRSFVSSIICLGAKLKHKPRSFDTQRDPSPPQEHLLAVETHRCVSAPEEQ